MNGIHRLGSVPMRNSVRLLAVALAIIAVLPGSAAQAATWYFSGTSVVSGSQGNSASVASWSTLSNWNSNSAGTGTLPGSAPGASDDPYFVTSNNTNGSNFIAIGSGTLATKSLTFTSSGSSFFVRTSGSSSSSSVSYLSLTSGITLNAGSGPVTFVSVGAPAAYGSGTLAGNRVAIQAANAALSLVNESSSRLTLERATSTSVASGTATITVTGNGTGGVLLTGLDNGTSGTTALTVNLPNGALLLDNGTYSYSGNTTITTGIVGLGTVNSFGNSRVYINGGAIASKTNARIIANNVVVGGNFTAGGTGAGANTWTAASLTLNGSVDLTGAERTITVANTLTLGGTVSNGGLVFTVPSGASGKTVTLSGSNAYSGGTTLSGDFAGGGSNILAVGHVNALGSGPLAVNAGTVNLGTTGVAVGLLSGSSGATITTSTSGASVTLTTAGATDSEYAGLITSGSGTVALAKTGAGTLTLTGANSYSGGTTVSGGGITAGNAGALGSGFLSLAGNTTLGVTSGSLTIGALTTTGAATISLAGLTNGIASSGALSFGGFADTITVGGSPSAGTYTLVSGTSLAGASNMSLTGAAVGGLTLTLGNSGTSGRKAYQFTSTGTSLQLITTANVSSLTWAPSIPSGDWDFTAANWVTGTFTDEDNVAFGSDATVTVPATVAPGTMSITNATGTVAFSGAGTIAATTLLMSGAGASTIANGLTTSNGVTVSNGSLTTGDTLGIAGGGLTVTGGAFTSNGATTITTGGLNVSGGSFSSNGAITVSTGGVNVSGGSAAFAVPNSIAGGITVTGGTAALNAANTVSGVVSVSNGGTLSLGSVGGAGTGSISLDNGTLASTLVSGTVANTIALGGGGGTLAGANPLTFSGAITGPGAFTKTGGGEFVASGQLGAANANVAVNVAAGSSLRLTGAAIKWLSNTVTGTVDGTLTLDNATLVLQSGTLGGTVSTGTGTIALVGASSITGTLGTGSKVIATPISGVGSLSFSAQNTGYYVTLSGSNTYSGGTILNHNVGMGSASAFGTGTITANSTSARINNVAGGPLTLANPVSTGAGFVFGITGANAPIQLTGTIVGSGTIRASSSGIVDLTQQTTATMQNTGAVDVANGGQMWVSSADNFGSNASILFTGTGAYLVATANTGTITQAVKMGDTGNPANVNANIDTGAFTVTLGGVVSNLNSGTTGGLVKTGVGTLILAANNTYTRDTTVSAGTLLVNGALYSGTPAGATTVGSGATLGGSGTIGGTVNVSGILSPGSSPGVLSVAGLSLLGTSTTLFEISGTARGSQYDGITLTGTAPSLTYGGTMSIAFASSFAEGTYVFDLFGWSGTPSIGGTFAGVASTGNYAGTWSSPDSGTTWNLNYDANTTLSFSRGTGDLTLSVVPEPGSIVLAVAGLAALAAIRTSRRRGG